MNNSRVNFTEIQTLTRSEYVSAKLIPSAAPLKKIEPEDQDGSTAIEPTPKVDSISTSKRNVRENEEQDLHLFEKPKRRAVNKSDLYDSASDTHLSEQIRQYNRVIEAQVQEVEYFKEEIRRLQEEKMLNVQSYEQKLMNYRDQELIKYELERRVRFLESEKAALEDDLNRQKLRVSSLEFEIEQLRRQNMTQHDLHLKIEELNGEVRYHENQVKQARVIQISLEQELRQRADERALLISEYEVRIANLQNDLVLHKETRKLDDSDQNHFLHSLREENLNLSNDNKHLRTLTRDLQNQIDRIRDEHFQTEMSLKKRINEFETVNSNSPLAAEKLQQQADNFNINKVLLMIEIDRLRDELSQQLTSKNLSVIASPPRAFDEQNKRAAIRTVHSPEMISKNQALEAKNQNLEQSVSQLENKAILFMIEIERLGIIVQELQNENTFLRQKSIELDQNYQKQIDDFQQQYEFVIRPQIEAEIRNTTNSIEREKKTLELEIYDHKNEAVRLKNEIFMLQAENTKAKDRNRELTLKLEDTVSSYEKFIQESNNMKRSLEEESRLKLIQQREGIDTILIQERQSHQKDIAVYKERILELENRITSLSLQINGLQRNLDDSDDQINILKGKLVDAENERIHQLEQLRNSLEANFRQTYQNDMELKIMQLEAMHTSLEDQLKKSKDEIAYLEEQNGILNRETEQLVIEISEKTTLIEQYHSQIILLKDQNREIYALRQKQEEIQTQFVEEAKQRELSLERDYQDRLEKDLKKAHDNFHNEKAAFETHQQENQGALNDEISQLQAQMQRLHEENTLFEAHIQELTQEHQETLSKERAAFEVQLQKLEQEKAILESQLQQLEQEGQEMLNNERLGFETHLQKLQQEHQQVYDSEKLAFETQLEKLKQETQGALSDELSQLQVQIQKLYQENQRILDNERTGFEAHIQNLEQDHQRILNNERAAFEAQLQKLEQEKAILETQLQEGQEMLNNERLGFEAHLLKLQQEHQETLDNERIAFEAQLQKLEQDKTILETQLQEGHEMLNNERLGFETHLQKLQQEHQESLNNERAALEAQLQKLEEEKAILESQLQKLEQEHQQILDNERLGFEAHLQKLQQEHQQILDNERLGFENHLQKVQIENQHILDNERTDFETQMEKIQKENQHILENERASFEAQLQRLEQENGELHTRLLENISVIEQLQTAVTASEKEKQTLASQRDNLLAEIEKMHINFETQIRQNIEVEIENVSAKYNQEKREIEDSLFALQAQNQDLRVKAILYMAEIERLHTIIFEIEKEEDVWRERIIDMENQNALRLEEQKNEYEDILRDKLVTEIEKIQTRVQEEKRMSDKEVNLLQMRNKELQESLGFANQENSRLRNDCLEKEDELQTLMIRINNLAHEQEEYVRGLKIGIQTQLRIDFENQIKDITGRFNNEKTAFEDQIRQLRNRVSEMELKLMTVQTQNDNLNRNLEDNYNQIDVLKNRCFELETEAAQAQKKLQESPKRASPQQEREIAMLRAQVQELEMKNQEYFRDLSLLSVEIERISKINFDLKSEADNLRIKAESLERRSQVEVDQTKIKLEIQFREERDNMAKEINTRFLTEIKNYDAQVMDLRKKLIDYEGDMSLLTNEIQRLSALLSDKNEELDVWKGKVRSIEQSKNQELQEIKQKRDFDQRIILEQELRNLLDHFSIEKAQYDFKIKDLQEKNTDYENKIVAITVELDKFKSLYKEKLQDIENLKRQSPTKSDYSTIMEYEEMRLHLESLKRNSLQISDYEVRFQAERTAYEAQIMQYKHKIEELETIIVSITRESQRLSSHLLEKGIEVQNIRKQSGFIGMVDLEEHQKLQRENENLKKLLLENQEARVRFEVERSDYQSQVVQLKQIIEVNQLEMKKLYGLLESRKVENEALYNDLNKTREEMARTLREFKGMEAEYNYVQQKSTNVNKEIEDLQNARDMYRTQLEKNEIELTLKNKELLEKICQIDVLKAKYEEAIANVDPITSTIITRISTTRQEI